MLHNSVLPQLQSCFRLQITYLQPILLQDIAQWYQWWWVSFNRFHQKELKRNNSGPKPELVITVGTLDCTGNGCTWHCKVPPTLVVILTASAGAAPWQQYLHSPERALVASEQCVCCAPAMQSFGTRRAGVPRWGRGGEAGGRDRQWLSPLVAKIRLRPLDNVFRMFSPSAI